LQFIAYPEFPGGCDFTAASAEVDNQAPFHLWLEKNTVPFRGGVIRTDNLKSADLGGLDSGPGPSLFFVVGTRNLRGRLLIDLRVPVAPHGFYQEQNQQAEQHGRQQVIKAGIALGQIPVERFGEFGVIPGVCGLAGGGQDRSRGR